MKKKIALFLVGALAITSLAGCGKKNSNTGSEETVKRSGEFEIVVEDCVKSVCDYSAIPVELKDEYTVTQEILDYFYSYFLSNFGLKYAEVTDRTVVASDDIVLIGYKGFLGDEQFEGGTSKSDIYFDVANNTDLTNSSKYVDGFNTGLVGATVGGDASSTLTFPENYSENLAGKEVTFQFDIKGIYKKITIDEVTDQMIYDNFHEDYDMDTVEDFKNNVKSLLESEAASQKYSDIVDAVRDYVVANSEVVIPEGYEEARYNEYITSLKNDLSGTTLEDYVKNTYGVELAEAEEVWHETIQNEIKAEILFKYIADKEGLTLDEDGYNTYVDNIISNSSGSLADSTAVYNYYGNNHVDEGETYVRNLYVVTLAIRFVEEKAVVTYTSEEDSTESTESTEK